MWKFLRNLFLTLVSAFIGALAFPSFMSNEGYPIFAFLFLIPLFYVVFTSSLKYSWFLGWVYGFVYYLIYNYWLKTFHPLAILLAPILESFQYIILFTVLTLLGKLYKKRAYIPISICYSAYLYLTQQGFLAYPYGNLTAAVYEFLPFIQIVDIGGIWLLGLIMVLPQALVAAMLSEKKLSPYKVDILSLACLYILTLTYGCFRMHYYDEKSAEKTIRIATVQHSADSWEGGYTTYARNFETMKKLSLEAMEEDPDMVVWSETAFVPSVPWHVNYPHNSFASQLVNKFVEFGTSLSVPLVTGNPEGVIADESKGPFLEDGSFNWKTYNTVMLFGDGKVVGTYRKQHLVPFTEHFPYGEQFPRLYQLLLDNDYNWWETGYESTVFDFNDLRFSTPICFEDTFGYLSAGFVQNGAELLINLSNDSWSGSVAAEMQHMQLGTFRAIENRRPLVRSTNSGITCLVDINGRVIDPLTPFIEAYNVYDVEVGKEQGLTFYTKHPDLFGKLLLVFAVLSFPLGIYVCIVRKRKEKIEALYLKYGALFDDISDFYEV